MTAGGGERQDPSGRAWLGTAMVLIGIAGCGIALADDAIGSLVVSICWIALGVFVLTRRTSA